MSGGGRAIPAIWALGAALLIEQVAAAAWWHPYCDRQDDGPGYYGVGLPLPYTAFSGVSSMEFAVMPHIFALDIAILAALIFPLMHLANRRLAARRVRLRRGVYAASLIACAGIAAFQAMDIAATWLPVRSIALPGYDGYLDYRPAAFAQAEGHRPCAAYPGYRAG